MASKGINRVTIVGNLGQDPEIRYTPGGAAITNISVATSESWKDKNTGQTQEATEWHRVVFFGKLAEIAGEYLKKGSQVYVEGKLKTRKWQDKQGQDRYSTEIIVDSFSGVMQMLGGAGQSGHSQAENKPANQSQQQQNQQPQQQGQQQYTGPHRQQGQQQNNQDFDNSFDDLPF